VPTELLEEQLEQIYHTKEDIMHVLLNDATIHFGLYLINYEQIKRELVDQITNCFNVLTEVLVAKIENLVTVITN
jgi:hypothetical protein